MNEKLLTQLGKIKLLILDVDGVLTDGKVWLSPNGEETKAFHVHDGLGISALRKAGITVAIISGRESKVVTQRMKELQVQYVFQGQHDKLPAFEQLLSELQLNKSEVAYVGDDLPDLPILQQVGAPIAVKNAVTDVKAAALWVTELSGGAGAVREVADAILDALSREQQS